MISKHSDANAPTIEGRANGTHDLGRVGGVMDDRIDLVLANDMVNSFRSLMKRYCFGLALYSDISIAESDVFRVIHRLPVRPAKIPSNSVFGQTMACYAGTRGAYRVRIIPRSHFGVTRTNELSRADVNLVSVNRWTHPGREAITTFAQAGVFTDGMLSGEQLSTNEQSNVLTFELPYYSNKRFLTFDDDATGFEFSIYFPVVIGTMDYRHIDFVYYAPGEDFNCFFFLGVAPRWQDPSDN